jgi:hypothetical protein
MLGSWLNEMESLEKISQDDAACTIFLRLAAHSRDGRLGTFLTALARDEDLDVETKWTIEELGKDSSFLLALEDYVERTRRLH